MAWFGLVSNEKRMQICSQLIESPRKMIMNVEWLENVWLIEVWS